MEHINAYIKAQSEMGSALKRANNPFLKSSYADLNSIIEVVYPAFHQNGFAIVQDVGRDEFGDFVCTSLQHNSGKYFQSRVYLSYKNGDMQSYGGAITYARRYGLLTACGVAVEDDDGNRAVGKERMQIKQDIKENRLTKAQQDLLARADKIEHLAKSASVEQISQFQDEVLKVVQQIHAFRQDRAIQIEVIWDSRKQELGLK